MKRVVILTNDTTQAYNLRGAIIEQLIQEGCTVIIVSQLLAHQIELRKMGAKLIGVKTKRRGKNPFADVHLYLQYRKILKRLKPDIVLTYNIKPNVYGGMACKLLKIHYITNVTGLGTPLEVPGPLQKLAIKLYKLGVLGADCIFFQNKDNREFFQRHHMLKSKARTRLLPGSGVDLRRFQLLPWHEGKLHFLFVARVMKEKGIDLFLAVAHRYASENIIFDICGPCEDPKYLRILQNDSSVVYHGPQSDLTPFYEECSCFLYPSYYPEGMSNVLLEAAASGRPVIAADRPGCRETLEDGVTGFLVPVNDKKAVLKVTEQIINMSVEQRQQMGMLGRKRIQEKFDRKIVVKTYIEEIKKINLKVNCKLNLNTHNQETHSIA